MNTGKPTVIMGIPYPGGQLWDQMVFGLLANLCDVQAVLWEAGAILQFNRNNLVKRFMGSKAEWFLAMDSDMVLPSGTVPHLLSCQQPMVSALYSARGNAALPIAKCKDKEGVYQPLTRGLVEAEKLVQVNAVGLGCCLIHRSVFEQVPYPWFCITELKDEKYNKWRRWGEDVLFCQAVETQGISIHVDCGWKVGHLDSWAMYTDFHPIIRDYSDEKPEQALSKVH